MEFVISNSEDLDMSDSALKLVAMVIGSAGDYVSGLRNVSAASGAATKHGTTKGRTAKGRALLRP